MTVATKPFTFHDYSTSIPPLHRHIGKLSQPRLSHVYALGIEALRRFGSHGECMPAPGNMPGLAALL